LQGASIDYSATAFDLVDETVPLTCTPISGGVFPIGETTVQCRASDAAGNESTGQFTVIVLVESVEDTNSPEVIVPNDFIIEATNPLGATVPYSASALDVEDGNIVPLCEPPRGSTFSLGDTQVRCSATDSAGHTSSATFTVTVVDTTPPQLVLPGEITIEATGPSGGLVNYSVSATDLVSGAVPVHCDLPAGSVFPLGQSSVICSASDGSLNHVQGQFTIFVQDTVAPAVQVPSHITVTATSSSGSIVHFDIAASDIVDGAVLIECSPASGSLFAVGTSIVQCSATDSTGNIQSASFPVHVDGLVSPPAFHICPVNQGMGNVIAKVRKETLRIVGDKTANCVRVEPSVGGQIRVLGLNGTHINGQDEFVTLGRVQNVQITMEGNDDAVDLVDLAIGGFLNARFNRGADRLALRHVEALGRTMIRMGNSKDSLFLDGSHFAGPIAVNLRAGNDELCIRSTDLSQHSQNISGGLGFDTLCEAASGQTLSRPKSFERHSQDIDAFLGQFQLEQVTASASVERVIDETISIAGSRSKRHGRRSNPAARKN
jgi:hypothetical protein